MLSTAKASLIFLATYLAVSFLVFGHGFMALYLLLLEFDLLPKSIWIPSLTTGAVLAGLFCFGIYRIRKSALVLIPSIFLVLFVLITLTLLSNVTTKIQNDKIKTLQPDLIKVSSFLSSMPRGMEFFGRRGRPHVAALKDCKPYYWSCRDMEFYKLSPNIAVNVFPVGWVIDCNIRRTTS